MGIKYWFHDKKNLVFLILVLALLTMPFVLTLFRLTLLGKFLCYAIVALGIDLIWGYTGILSLGHGVFFGLGAYAMAMHLKLVASGSSLPEFMVTGGLTQLPAFWKPFASAPFAFLASLHCRSCSPCSSASRPSRTASRVCISPSCRRHSPGLS